MTPQPTQLPPNTIAAGSQTSDPGTNEKDFIKYGSFFAGRNMKAGYDQTFAAWTHELRINDLGGLYYNFVLRTTAATAAWTHKAIYKHFRRICEKSTVRAFPHFSKSHPQRHPADQSFGVIVVPANSASGVLHDHGWIRIPRAADLSPRNVWIHDHNQRKQISAPKALADFVNEVLYGDRSPFSGFGTSLWIHHVNGRAQCDTEHDPGPGFSYLLKTADGEIRQWANAEHVPNLVFKRLYDMYVPTWELNQ